MSATVKLKSKLQLQRRINAVVSSVIYELARKDEPDTDELCRLMRVEMVEVLELLGVNEILRRQRGRS